MKQKRPHRLRELMRFYLWAHGVPHQGANNNELRELMNSLGFRGHGPEKLRTALEHYLSAWIAKYGVPSREHFEKWIISPPRVVFEKREPPKPKAPQSGPPPWTISKHQTAKAARVAFYESDQWRAIRYQALRLHGGCCQCCGRRPNGNNPLHVDHIKPRSKHPELELQLSNLQVLCADCNLGKSNRDQTDWREYPVGQAATDPPAGTQNGAMDGMQLQRRQLSSKEGVAAIASGER